MYKTHWILCLIILCAGFTRFYKLDEIGLTTDEIVTLAIANGQDATVYGGIRFYADSVNWLDQIKNQDNFFGTVDATIHDNGNALLYNLSVHFVTKFFGNTDVPFKATSVICGILMVASIFVFTRRNIGKKAAYLASILVALHPFLIEYSQLSRGYIMASLFSLLATHIFFILLSSPLKRTMLFLLYSLCIVAALLSHYFTAFIFVGHGVIILFYYRERKNMLLFSFAFLLAFFLFSIWLFNGGLKGQELMIEQNNRWKTLASLGQSHQFSFSNLAHILPKCLNALSVNKIGSLALPVFFGYISAMGYLIFLIFFLFRNATKFIKELVIIPLVFLLFITIISFFTGHTLAFDLRYATPIFPIFSIFTAFAILSVFESKRIFGFIVLFVFLGVETVCTYPSLIVEVRRMPSNIELSYSRRAALVEDLQEQGDSLFFPSVNDAILINLYFNQQLSNCQFVDRKIGANNLLLKQKEKNVFIPLDPNR